MYHNVPKGEFFLTLETQEQGKQICMQITPACVATSVTNCRKISYK